jgi:D,D-heptose 1,7-bisphosphate phosphatase
MKRPAVFFDRDNTLIATDEYLGDPAKVQLIEGAADAVARVRRLGFATVIFSNQSGVARGMYDEAAVHAVNAKLDELLKDHHPDAVIDRHEFCPYHPEGTVECYRQDSDLRKPKAGMILRAAEKLALDLSRSWVIGDAPRDIEAGHAAGCRTILFTDPMLSPSPAAAAETKVPAEFRVSSLKEAVDLIERNATASEETLATSERPILVEQHANGPSNPMKMTTPVPPREPEPPAPIRLPELKPPAVETPVPPRPVESIPSTARLESLADQILQEIKRRNDQTVIDFSVSKLLAGIVQVIVLATLFIAYIKWDERSLQPILLLAMILQTLTISLLIMGRQK